jgi:hypothetical protein
MMASDLIENDVALNKKVCKEAHRQHSLPTPDIEPIVVTKVQLTI